MRYTDENCPIVKQRTKTPEQLAVQKAIVCAYLRLRWARARRPDLSSSGDDCDAPFFDGMYEGEYQQAYNTLEHLKRVLWNNDWS